MRVEVCFRKAGLDSRGVRLGAETLDVYLWEGPPALAEPLVSDVFADPVVQIAVVDGTGPDRSPRGDWTWLVEVSYKAGVTNPMAITIRIMIGTNIVAVSKLLAELMITAPSPEIVVKNSAITIATTARPTAKRTPAMM